MTKALVAVNHATYGGVYYSDTIDFLNLATQPTWTRLATTGLANTLIKVMQNDYFTPYDDIYIQLTNDDVYRWDSPVWTKIIDLATARTLASRPSDTMKYIYVDRKTAGTIWVALNPNSNTEAPVFIRSLDYGATWTVLSPNTIDGWLNTGLAHFVAHGNDIACVYGHIYNGVWISSDLGANWTEVSIWGNSGATGTLRQDTFYPGTVYHVQASGNFNLLAVTTAGGVVKLSDNQLGSYNYDRMWIDPITAGHHRILRLNSGNVQIFATTDRWTTLVDATPDVLASGIGTTEYGALAAARESNAYIMAGYQTDSATTGNQAVMGVYGEDASSWTGIAGANNATPPYTNAIPSVANLYVAVEGIYVGNAPASGGIEVYSVETGDLDYDHKPMKGDRSAHHTLSYPDEHAEDVAKDTPTIHNPWPMASGNIAVSDGNKLVETTPATFGIHAAVTLAADADTLLGLTGQQLTLNSKNANLVLAGPTTGAAVDPTFRAIVAADLAAGADANKYLRGDMAWAALDAAILDFIHEHAIDEDLSGLCDGSRTVFILANEYKPETTAIYLNGVRQLLVTDYTEDAGYDQITMTTAPEAGDILTADYILAGAI